MTTPDGASAKKPGGKRIRRKPPQRSSPDRSGASARTKAAESRELPANGSTGPGFDEAVANSVKTAYDVLADTIEKGRQSAEHFRHGEYNFRDVPGDVRHLAENMLRLARQLSTTTFDVCEALLAQQPASGGPPPTGTTPVPPFRQDGNAATPPGSARSPQPVSPQAAASSATMRLGVEFTGAKNARAHTTGLSRPTTPVHPDEISAAPLISRHGGSPLTQVAFAADLVNGGLRATVTVPKGQAGGIYSGAVFSAGQDLPLGMLVIELPQPARKPRG